ncbi:unnamed protein product [Chrysoparadoxa australica]
MRMFLCLALFHHVCQGWVLPPPAPQAPVRVRRGVQQPTAVPEDANLQEAKQDAQLEPLSIQRRDILSGIGVGAMSVAAGLTASVSAPESALAAIPAASPGTKVVVLGGSGFVGSRVCEQLVGAGANVVSISRTGKPSWATSSDWSGKVTWVAGDVLTSNVSSSMKAASAVVSCIGVIGFDNDQLKTGNGDANVAAVDQAKAAGAKRFVYVSVASSVQNAFDPALLPGYFQGKRDAEEHAVKVFGEGNYAFIKPSFIYGGSGFSLTPPRVPDGYGSFIKTLLSLGPLRAAAGISPGPISVALQPPVSVNDVAAAVAQAALGRNTNSRADGTDEIEALARA